MNVVFLEGIYGHGSRLASDFLECCSNDSLLLDISKATASDLEKITYFKFPCIDIRHSFHTDLEIIYLSHAEFKFICVTLKQCSQIRKLSIGRNSVYALDEARFSVLCQILDEFAQLEELDLSYNDLNRLDVAKLKMLGQVIIKLKVLSLRDQRLHTLEDAKFAIFWQILMQCSQLRHLVLDGVELDILPDAKFNTLCFALAQCQQLQSLSIANSHVGMLSEVRLATLYYALSKCKQLQMLSMESNNLGKINRVVTLSFSVLEQLETLNLDGNELGDWDKEKFGQFINMLKICKKLRKVILTYNNLQYWQLQLLADNFGEGTKHRTEEKLSLDVGQVLHFAKQVTAEARFVSSGAELRRMQNLRDKLQAEEQQELIWSNEYIQSGYGILVNCPILINKVNYHFENTIRPLFLAEFGKYGIDDNGRVTAIARLIRKTILDRIVKDYPKGEDREKFLACVAVNQEKLTSGDPAALELIRGWINSNTDVCHVAWRCYDQAAPVRDSNQNLITVQYPKVERNKWWYAWTDFDRLRESGYEEMYLRLQQECETVRKRVAFYYLVAIDENYPEGRENRILDFITCLARIRRANNRYPWNMVEGDSYRQRVLASQRDDHIDDPAGFNIHLLLSAKMGEGHPLVKLPMVNLEHIMGRMRIAVVKQFREKIKSYSCYADKKKLFNALVMLNDTMLVNWWWYDDVKEYTPDLLCLRKEFILAVENSGIVAQIQESLPYILRGELNPVVQAYIDYALTNIGGSDFSARLRACLSEAKVEESIFHKGCNFVAALLPGFKQQRSTQVLPAVEVEINPVQLNKPVPKA